MLSIYNHNRDVSDSSNFDEIACKLLQNLSQLYLEANQAISKVNMGAILFAKFVYQYYVCTDQHKKPVVLDDHVYDATTGELDFFFFLSMKSCSYNNGYYTNSLNKKIVEVYEIYKTLHPEKLPSIAATTICERNRIIRNEFKD